MPPSVPTRRPSDLGRVAALDLDVDAHAVLVGLVAQLTDALVRLLLDQVGDLLDQPRLVYLVRDLGDDDRLAAVVGHLDVGARAHAHPAAAGAVGQVDAADAVDDPGGGEIRTRDGECGRTTCRERECQYV